MANYNLIEVAQVQKGLDHVKGLRLGWDSEEGVNKELPLTPAYSDATLRMVEYTLRRLSAHIQMNGEDLDYEVNPRLIPRILPDSDDAIILHWKNSWYDLIMIFRPGNFIPCYGDRLGPLKNDFRVDIPGPEVNGDAYEEILGFVGWWMRSESL